MTSQLVLTTIRRSNRNRMIISGLGILLVIGVGLLNMRYLSNFFAGPAEGDRAELLALENPEALDRYWVNVIGDEGFETGVQEITTGRYGSESVSAEYIALLMDDRLLLVATKDPTPAMQYTGALVPIDADVQRDVVDDLEAEADIEGAFLPYMLDARDFRSSGYFGLGIGGVILAACLFGLVTAAMRSNVQKHPIMQRLTRHGDPALVISEIENELLAPRWTHGKLHVTQNWLVQSEGANFNAMRLSEVAWVYKHVTQRRVNGIPAGKTFAAHIHDSHGQKMEVTAKNAQDVDLMLQGIHSGAPWALAGYDDQLEKSWKSNRAMVVDAVAQRRQSMFGAKV